MAKALHEQGVPEPTARKQISRVRPPIFRFPASLLPKKESFLYHEEDRPTERFWSHFMRDMRETNSIYGAAVDALIARGGAIPIEQFGTVSAGTVTPRKGQVSAKSILQTLKFAQILSDGHHPDYGECIRLTEQSIADPDVKGIRRRNQAELILLDAIREWARKLGLASYDKIVIRGEQGLKPVGPYAFDLVGPSYIMPLLRDKKQPGFLVADVIAEGRLDEYQIRSFIRKTQGLKATLSSGVFPILLAEGFTGPAFTAGRKAGVVLATYETLFGTQVAASIQVLLKVLSNAATHASADPDKLAKLVNDLSSIEGSAGNLRGILFELIAACLIRRSAASIDIGVAAYDNNGGKADIDVLKIGEQGVDCVCIECKGKGPGGVVSQSEVEKWLGQIPIFQAHLKRHYPLREAKVSFEIWTSGTFDDDALAKLKLERERRTKNPISWMDGFEVLALARKYKMKTIAGALETHYLKHPLAEISSAQEKLGLS